MNKVILMGRLTRDLEVKVTGSTNTTVLNGTIAVDKGYTKPGEERKADFINLVAFGKTAEFINKYFKKGERILITGKIQTRTWDDTEGKKHYATDVIVDEAEFVESKKGQAQDEEISLPSNDDTEDIFK